MIFFFADGRLGNQLFQYAFLKTIARENEQIIVSGFEELKDVFEIKNIINLNKKNKWIKNFMFKIFNPFFNFLADNNIISSISVDYEQILDKYKREASSYTKQNGIFDFIILVKLGFFQSEKFFDESIIKKLKIKDKYLTQANVFLNSIPSNSNKVFIHIRRGDYKDYYIYDKSTLVPNNYFHKQIKWFLQNRINCFFVFLSDEPDFIEKEFDYLNDKKISFGNHFGTDLAIMTKCNSAILSPSSFGWWGSYFMINRDLVVAPRYWQGFNSKEDFHQCPLAKYMTGVEVCAES